MSDLDATSDGQSETAPAHGFELGTDGPKAIIVGVDGSETSLHAGAYAAGLARRQGSRLIVVYVKQAMGMAYAAEVAAVAAATNNEVADEIRALIQQQSSIWNFPVDYVATEGDPYTVITGIADDVSADAIVVGASTKMGHRIAGSLAIRLVKCGRWPVTVVP